LLKTLLITASVFADSLQFPRPDPAGKVTDTELIARFENDETPTIQETVSGLQQVDHLKIGATVMYDDGVYS
jgi:hypothetical protein